MFASEFFTTCKHRQWLGKTTCGISSMSACIKVIRVAMNRCIRKPVREQRMTRADYVIDSAPQRLAEVS